MKYQSLAEDEPAERTVQGNSARIYVIALTSLNCRQADPNHRFHNDAKPCGVREREASMVCEFAMRGVIRYLCSPVSIDRMLFTT